MEELHEYRQRLLARLTEIAEDLPQALGQIPTARIFKPFGPDGWNVHKVIAHLRDMEAMAFLPRMRLISEKHLPVLERFEWGPYAQTHYREDEPVVTILAEFAELRKQERELLDSLSEGGWNREGRHPLYGVRTLQWWVEYSLAHAEEHLKQIQELLKHEQV